jgi:hypothetical protein
MDTNSSIIQPIAALVHIQLCVFAPKTAQFFGTLRKSAPFSGVA